MNSAGASGDKLRYDLSDTRCRVRVYRDSDCRRLLMAGPSLIHAASRAFVNLCIPGDR